MKKNRKTTALQGLSTILIRTIIVFSTILLLTLVSFYYYIDITNNMILIIMGVIIGHIISMLIIFVYLKHKDTTISMNSMNNDSIAPEIESIFDWLYKHSSVIRTKQTLLLKFENCDYEGEKSIRVIGIHKYSVSNPDDTKTIKLPVNAVAELGQRKENSGGFLFAMIGDRAISSTIIDSFVSYDAIKTKAHFHYVTNIQASETVDFEFHTFGIYRLCDRLTWIFQDFGDDFHIKVENNVNEKVAIYFKMNHHEREYIESKCIENTGSNEYNIEFRHPIAPYEGFSMHWDFPDDYSIKESWTL
jgi:hypothetical protein